MLFACQYASNLVNPPIEPVKGPIIVPPSCQKISSKEKCSQYANKQCKKNHSQAKAHNLILEKSLSSLDTNMHYVLEEFVANNDVKLPSSNDSIFILDPILINLDDEDTLDDTDDVNDEYDNIDINVDLPNILSSQSTLTPSI